MSLLQVRPRAVPNLSLTEPPVVQDRVQAHTLTDRDSILVLLSGTSDLPHDIEADKAASKIEVIEYRMATSPIDL